MSFLPPTAINDAWSLLQIIAHPDRSKEALEILKKESETAAEIMEGARAAQRDANDKIQALASDRKEFEKERQEFDAEVKKREHELFLIQNEQTNRANVLKEQEHALALLKEHLEGRAEFIRGAERILQERSEKLDRLGKDLSDREAKVKAIMDEFGPLAEKLKG